MSVVEFLHTNCAQYVVCEGFVARVWRVKCSEVKSTARAAHGPTAHRDPLPTTTPTSPAAKATTRHEVTYISHAMNIAQSTGSDDSLDTSLSFELSASPGDLTYLSLTLNLTSDFVKVSNAWDWSDCSTVFKDALEAVSDVLPLLQEIHQGIGDPRYILSADLWPLIKACRQQLLTFDEWIISNAPDFDKDVRRWNGAYDPLTNVLSYGRQIIRNQVIADHYKHADREADVIIRVKHAFVQFANDLEHHLELSHLRIRSRLEALTRQLRDLSHASRCRIWQLYGDALQGKRDDSWNLIAETLSLP